MINEDTRDVFRRTLQEGLSSVVYHMTSLDSTMKILKTGRFMTAVAFGTAADAMINKGKLYYFSTMRSPQSYYRRGMAHGNVLFTLNGRAIGARYKASPVDYWGPEWRKLAPTQNEMEDRIYTDEAYIPNALKYITDARAVMSVDGVSTAGMTKLFAIERLLSKRGISFRVFTTDKSFRTISASGLSVREYLELVKSKGKVPKSNTAIDDFRRRFPKRPSKSLVGIVDVIRAINNGTGKSALSKDGKDVAHRISYSDAEAGIAADIHNHKSDAFHRPQIAEIGLAMKRAKLKTAHGLTDWLRQINN